MEKYWWSFYQDSEIWTESGTSVADCIEQAKELNDADYQTVYIGEAVPFVPSEHLNVDVLMDDLEQQAYEFAGEVAEDWHAYAYKETEANRELSEAIGEIVDKWLKKHGRYPGFCQIANVAEYDLYGDDTHERSGLVED